MPSIEEDFHLLKTKICTAKFKFQISLIRSIVIAMQRSTVISSLFQGKR